MGVFLRLLFCLLLSLVLELSYCQKPNTFSMKNALSLLTDKIGWIEKSGYKVNGVTLLTDWGGLRLRGYDLFANHPDSIYVEAFAVVDKRDYTVDDENLSVWKLTNPFYKSRDSLIVNKSVTRSIARNSKVIDSWKIGFVPNKDGDIVSEYLFNLESLDDTRIGSIGNYSKVVNEREMILIVYSK